MSGLLFSYLFCHNKIYLTLLILRLMEHDLSCINIEHIRQEASKTKVKGACESAANCLCFTKACLITVITQCLH